MRPNKFFLAFFILNIFSLQFAFSHYKAKYHVIIDTDGGIDDFRAICMILANPEIEVIGIVTTDGVLAPEETCYRLISLLQSFGHEGIPVAAGKKNLENPPEFRAFAGSLLWGQQRISSIDNGLTAVELIIQETELEEMPVEYIALGPLTNLAEALANNAGLLHEFGKIYWYDKSFEEHGLNYSLNPIAAEKIINSSLELEIINAGPENPGFDKSFISALDTIFSDYAHAIQDFYRINRPVLQDHFMGISLADDCIPLYLAFPDQFNRKTLEDDEGKALVMPIPERDLQSYMLAILDCDKEDKSILFKTFPVSPGLFENDLSPSVGQMIQSHGLKEWKIMVLTNEFHEHLGIYSIVGAKMGLRAREYFRVGIDELTIKSLAGSTPPVSCLNDGLQVSTGATLGHGTISVGDSDPSPAAIFTFKNRAIMIELKENIKAQIMNDVQSAVRAHGINTPGYWQAIRQLAIRYWLELDRGEIFEIRVVR